MKTVKIDAPRWGDLNGTQILITDSLWASWDQGFRELLPQGRALRAFKHLVQAIKNHSTSSVLVLTDGPSKKVGARFHVNVQRYRSKANGIFFAMYGQTGKRIAQEFLGVEFPNDFAAAADSSHLSGGELKKASKNVGQVVEDLTKTATKRRTLLKKVSDELEKLRSEKARLKGDVSELDQLRRQSSIAFYMEGLAQLKDRFPKNLPETTGQNSWQKWIYKNNWVMGTLYRTPIEKTKVGFDSIPDYLFPTIDGFLDILEIKKPDHEVIREDGSHPGSYAWSIECSKAIGQVANYIHEMDMHQLELSKRINLKYKDLLGVELTVLRPRGFVLIGNSGDWPDTKKEALRKLNYTLHGVEVLTYAEVYARAERLVDLYSDKPTAA